MTGKSFKVPKDMADANDYRVELHPSFTDERDQAVLYRALTATNGHTLGTAVALLGRWHDVKMEIQMPVPRERPWQQNPVVLVYPEDWQVRHPPPEPPPASEPTEPQGEGREGWKKIGSLSYVFGDQRYPVHQEPEENKWRASFWEASSTHTELWKAQKWIEDLERERVRFEAASTDEAPQGAEYQVVYYRGVPEDGPHVVNGRRLEHNTVMRLDAEEIVGLAEHFSVGLVTPRDYDVNGGVRLLWLEDKRYRFGQR